MNIVIEDLRKKIENRYVGLSPSTSSVKPVHIANGLFRTSLGKTVSTRSLYRFVYSNDSKGNVPAGHSIEEVYSKLKQDGRIDQNSIDKEELGLLRVLLKKVVNADGAVYSEGMESYSAGFVGFLTKDRIGQDGGEFASEWLRKQESNLLTCLKQSLSSPDDVISMLSLPLLDGAQQDFVPTKLDYVQLACLNSTLPQESSQLWEGLRQAADTLALHIEAHPNKLLRLRLSVLFTCFFIVRHLACLEGYYTHQDSRFRILPFLLDFSSKTGSDPIARASCMSYTLVCQSISRFYAWAFGKQLSELLSFEELKRDGIPTYKGRPAEKEKKELWDLALLEAEQSNDPFSICGQALYDIMSLEAESNPVVYLRKLGELCGLLWPPNQTAKRFVFKQDLLETLVRGAVEPGTAIDLPTLQERFWNRYGIVIGGRAEDEERLIDLGIYQADGKSLSENLGEFATRLSSLDFARLLADGVLQVELEVS